MDETWLRIGGQSQWLLVICTPLPAAYRVSGKRAALLSGGLGPTLAEADSSSEWYYFERGARKGTHGDGWADVWKRGRFAWEYKGRQVDPDAAFNQVQQYALALEPAAADRLAFGMLHTSSSYLRGIFLRAGFR